LIGHIIAADMDHQRLAFHLIELFQPRRDDGDPWLYRRYSPPAAANRP
jgi:hypothetical protein